MTEIVYIGNKEVKIDIDMPTRVVKITYNGVVNSFNMDVDPYPVRGPLYNRVREICESKQNYIIKVLYPINKHRGLWDKYVLF